MNKFIYIIVMLLVSMSYAMANTGATEDAAADAAAYDTIYVNNKVAPRDTIVRHYGLLDEWYLMGQAGYSYLAAENTYFVNFTKIVHPEFSLMLGKRFNPVWGARLQVQWGDDTGVFYGHDSKSPTYDFSHTSVNVASTFNFSEYLKRYVKYGYNRRWNVVGILGLGFATTNFDKTVDLSAEKFLDLQGRTYPSLFAAIELGYSINEHIDVSLELGSHWMGKRYNGMIIERRFWLRKIDQSIPLMLGVRWTLGKPKRKLGPDRIIDEPAQMVIKPRVDTVQHGVRAIAPEPANCYTYEDLVSLAQHQAEVLGLEICCDENVDFDYGKHSLKIFSEYRLDYIVELMQIRPDIDIVLRGLVGRHANKELTDRRMQTIVDYLTSHGIDRDRIVYQYVPVGTPCVNNNNIRIELMDYGNPPTDNCYEIDELLRMAYHGEDIHEMSICGIDMVHFDTDKDIIKPDFAHYLDKLALLMEYTDIRILIMGHTDNQGSVDYNYDLSKRRAMAVLDYLHNKGVDYDRMYFTYHSKLKPFTENETARGRSINRRCEFLILP